LTGDKKLKVLFVEDIPSDAELAERSLRGSGLDVESRRVDTKEAFLGALADFDPDIVISDYSMPSFDGMSALILAKERDPLLPFIVLTGSMNEDVAVECMKAGASDYVIKEHMTRLPFAVKEALKHREIVTASTQKSMQLRESEERYRALFEESHAVMFIIDPEELKIVEANQAASEFYGWSKDELIGKKMTEYNIDVEADIRQNVGQSVKRKNHYFQLRHRKADGTIVDVEAYSGPIVLAGKTHLFALIHDVSDKVAAERERDEISSRLNHYLSTSPTVTYSLRIKEGKAPMQWVSENIRTLLGFTPSEALESDWWLRNVHASDRKRALGGISNLTYNRSAFGHEYRFHRKDRGIVWLRDEMRFVKTDKGEAEIIGTLTDISERKKIEGELSLKSQALEAAANTVVITDREGTIQWANAAFEGLTGFAPAEAIGKNPRVLKSGRQDSSFYRSLWDTILSGKVWQGEIINKRKDGELYTEWMTITPVLDDSRIISGFIAVKSDVTERMLSRERLEASLDEKEVLLREIHHRINNNMQLITSLLNLSSQKIADPSLRETLAGISRRVVSMALVHEQFYNSPDVARIDFLLYIHQLVEGLNRDFGRFFAKISVVSDSDEILLKLEKAIPAGLAATELITNALSHAYPGESPPGPIRVLLQRIGANIELTVSDEGIGFSDAFGADKAESLGMILIHTLAEQLRGKIEFHSHEGTEAILRFPID
jgi:PAS domain S-box-containing protein